MTLCVCVYACVCAGGRGKCGCGCVGVGVGVIVCGCVGEIAWVRMGVWWWGSLDCRRDCMNACVQCTCTCMHLEYVADLYM